MEKVVSQPVSYTGFSLQPTCGLHLNFINENCVTVTEWSWEILVCLNLGTLLSPVMSGLYQQEGREKRYWLAMHPAESGSEYGCLIYANPFLEPITTSPEIFKQERKCIHISTSFYLPCIGLNMLGAQRISCDWYLKRKYWGSLIWHILYHFCVFHGS